MVGVSACGVISGMVYKHVSACMRPAPQGLSAAQRKSLSTACLVPVANGTRLVPPSRLFGRLRDDLAPFAYEVPSAFAHAHAAILAELGMRDTPSGADLARFVLVRRALPVGHKAQ